MSSRVRVYGLVDPRRTGDPPMSVLDDFDLDDSQQLYTLLLTLGNGNYREARVIGQDCRAIASFRKLLLQGGYRPGAPPRPGEATLYEVGDAAFPKGKPFIFLSPLPDPALATTIPVSEVPSAPLLPTIVDELTVLAAPPELEQCSEVEFSEHRRSDLTGLDEDHYLRCIASIALPNKEQTIRFWNHLLVAHTWYKHVPGYPARTRLVFYLDPDAGKQREYEGEGLAGQLHLRPILDQSECWHYSQMLTVEYLERFGHWSFWVERPGVEGPECRAAIQLNDRTLLPVGVLVQRYCSCPAEFLLSNPPGILDALQRSLLFFEKAR